MRKIPHHYENPIDHILLHLCEIVAPWFRKLNVTPNMLTTISNCWVLVCVYSLYYRDVGIALLSFWIAYFFDCLDGHYARKYKMVTVFGDYYDHVSDIAKVISILVVLYILEPRKTVQCLPLLLLGGIGLCSHLYYQEKHYKAHEMSPTLAITEILGLPDDEYWISYTKWFGVGSFMLLLAVIMVLVV